MADKKIVKKSSGLDTVFNAVKNKRLPYNYIVGEKGGKPSPIPFDVLLSLDPDFKKTLLKVTGIAAGSVVIGWIGSEVIKKLIR